MSSSASTLATFILPIAKALRLQGVDPMDIFDAVGIDAASVINADRRIPVSKMQQLWRQSVETTGDEAFGLRAAEQLQPATLQGLGLAVLASDTIYDVLKRLVRFSGALTTGMRLSLERRDELVDLVMLPYDHELDEEYCWASSDFAMGLVLTMCRMTLGEYVSPLLIETRRPAPLDTALFESLLGARVKFGQQDSRMSFVHSDIVDQLVTGNSALAKVIDEQVENYLASFDDVTTARDVVSKIVERLPDGPPNQKQIAEALNVSNRTLQRKLKDEGTSFVDLLQDTRLKLAEKYLAQPRRSVVEISYLLGFSEPSTFSRAFKRWTGLAPQDYREQQLATQ